MNHIYRSIWSESLATWVAVPENTASKGKRSAVKKAVIATGLMAFSSVGFALPTGGQVVAGQVNINTPSATQMNIHQGSQNAIVNWNGFSIAAPETVTIQQPNISAVLLNRVVGVDASLIQGHLNANGQIFLVNPNGVLFSNTAQVDVGGLVASTNNISNADFLNGNYHFSQDGVLGAVSNQGFIKTPVGGTVALIGTQISNSGTIETLQGTTALAAGKTVDLDFKGNGLVEVKIPEAALNAQVANSGAIMADAGRVVLTAKAANQLAGTVINQTGLIQAHSLTFRKGEILLDGGDNGTVQAAGTLDVSGQNANGGTIKVFAGMQNGTLNVTGKLDASASGVAANGGFIETSAAHVKVADTAKVTTLAASGNSGTWLIDPFDFTIGAAGDMTGAAVGLALGLGNFSIDSTLGATLGTGDIFVNDAVSWSANTLTLNAVRNININASLNATGTGSLTLQAGNTITAPAAVSINGAFNLDSGAWNQVSASLPGFYANNFHINNSTGTFIRALSGTGASGSPYQLADVYGLQGMGSYGMLGNAYTLGNNIDASGTQNWGSEGFFPVGAFSGSFNGLGHTISGLYMNHSSSTFAGLGVGVFGVISSGSTISNVGLLNADITGNNNTGALVGSNYGNISNAYATGIVTGSSGVGGLVGSNYGNISNSYATGIVTGSSGVGGLVGYNSGSMSNAYATGDVSGTGRSGNAFFGGLVGKNTGSISNTYASGHVSGSSYVGGLVGSNYGSCCSGTIGSSFWDINSTGQSLGVGFGNSTGATGKSTAEMMQITTFSNAVWSIANTGGSSAIWRIYEGNTRPLLRSFLTPLTIYSNGTYSLASIDSSHLFVSGTGIYSDQQGYDISDISIPVLNLGPVVTPVFSPVSQYTDTSSTKTVTEDSSDGGFNADKSSPALPCPNLKECNQQVIYEAILKIINTAGRVLALQMSPDKHYLTLLMEDGSVRIWDFLSGQQRQAAPANSSTIDIGAVAQDTLVPIANKNGISIQEIISGLADEKLAIHLPNITHFVTSDDGSLLFVSTSDGNVILIFLNTGLNKPSDNKHAANQQPDSLQYASKQVDTDESEEVSSDDNVANDLPAADNQPQQKRSRNPELAANFSTTDNKKNQKLWKISYPRGAVQSLAMSKDKRYGAVLSRESGVYGLSVPDLKSKPLIDAVNIIDLATGKVIKTLPNQGENVVFMEFKDNDTLQIGLASGEVYNWSIATGREKTVADFAENVVAVDTDAARETFAFVLKDGTVRVGNDQNNVRLSIQNKENPFKYAKLLADGKRLLTVLASGDLALWDVASGKKLLRLFSMKDGWTVMDAFGRFDGSEGAIENFSWLANENNIPLDKFSENYYEPGLLSSVLQNQDFINENPSMIQSGITLPPKLNLQLAAQQNKGDNVALQLDVYDRGGGIDQIRVYQNGKLLSNENVVLSQTKEADHRLLKLNILPNPGKNTVKVVATNDMGVESSSSELSFDGKSKAYASSLKLLTVGINRYSDSRLNLSYSVADANAIAQSMKNHSKVAASKSLTDAKATKTRILAELKELSRGAQHDQLVIYLAGHGIASGKEWYFLPYETKMQPSIEKIVATGITATELGEIFKDSKIQHILLMVDACYSGASTDAFSKLENGQRYFTRQLSRSLGITVVTATTKDQEAAELQSLGHGLFTYLMTKEMDRNDPKNPVTAHSIAASIVKDLPTFSKKMLGVSQDPSVHTFGSDFMLTDPAAKTGQK